LTQNDESILQEIKSVLGFGRVYYDSSASTYRYRVTNPIETFKLAILFNGNLVTKNKIEGLGKWIEQFNKNGINIVHDPTPFIHLMMLSGLSGFSRSARFYVSVSATNQKAKRKRLDSKGMQEVKTYLLARLRFVITQKDEPVLLYSAAQCLHWAALRLRRKNLFGYGSGL
jgi:hypothetical protein